MADIIISKPNFERVIFQIVGTAPYVQNKFSQKAREVMRTAQERGSQKGKGTKRDGKNFEENFRQAIHVADEGWYGIPAPAFRNAMISACRIVGFKMTHAKLSIFVTPDGFDADDGTPLVKIYGEPEIHESMVRIQGTADVRWRPMWRQWHAFVRVMYDADQFSLSDVTNLLQRTGLQVGIGEGRPDSKMSAGMGWGTFTLQAEN